ncbi:MAG: molybdopterin biosynthesis protein [Treponema sp.]|nr:molybdopterin biosynthesis protein [Treponema sp.]
MPERSLFLSNTPVDEALKKYSAALEDFLIPQYEEIAVPDALDRVTRQAIYARCSSPLFNAAAMDGIAVQAAATAGASENRPRTLIKGRDFQIVDTGDPVHPPWDAVIMAEDAAVIDDENAQIREAAIAWQHIRPIGEDIVTGEMILPGRHVIRPIDIGVLLSGGITRVEVYAKPSVAIFPTGSEIIEPGQTPLEGQIIESNSRMFEAQVIQDGGIPARFAPVSDDYEQLRVAVSGAAERFDIVLVNAGSSAGTEDYTVHVLRELGEVIVHGVAIKPGKPVILALVKGKPVIGIPGYPVSAYLVYEIFVSPLVKMLCGRSAAVTAFSGGANRVEAVIAKRIVSSLKYREYVRVKVGRVDGKLVASPLARGAGAAMSLVLADGFCVIEQNSEGIDAGQTAPVELFRPLEEIDRTAVVTGSHDLILDVIADRMALESGGTAFLASAHTGSLAGLSALGRGECHITPSHLLDEETGEYNLPYIRRIFPDQKMTLIKGVGRVQGLMVQKGNPLDIQSIADITRCRYINRQRGAGTRLLLDLKLKQAGIAPRQITGYGREAATHMAAAAAVESGSADAALGIASAAAALGLDFIPLADEEYDFVLYPRFLDLSQVQAFLAILKSPFFHRRLAELGGYTWDHCGEIALVE